METKQSRQDIAAGSLEGLRDGDPRPGSTRSWWELRTSYSRNDGRIRGLSKPEEK